MKGALDHSAGAPTSVLSRAAVSATARHPPIARMCDFVRSRCPTRAHRAELAGRADAVRAANEHATGIPRAASHPGLWLAGVEPPVVVVVGEDLEAGDAGIG